MKPFKKAARHSKIALFAGATALMTLTNQSHAQASVDALLDKLEQKGILTTGEAKQLRDESQQDYNNNFEKAFDKATGLPGWVTGLNIYGSFRGRYEDFSAQNAAAIQRSRFRYRLFLGGTVTMKDNLEMGFRIGSGDQKGSAGQGNPLSQNSTMTGNFSDKGLYVDLAYGKWTPINDGNWKLSGTFGKMERPFDFTWMVIDPDITPEGGLVESHYNINDKNIVSLTGGLFALQDVANSTRDPAMYGVQAVWNSKWTDKWASTLGAGAVGIINPIELTTANAVEINQGNTRYTSGPHLGAPVYNLTPLIGDASVTYTLESFPLYTGAFPITLKGEAMHNPGAPDNNNGYWAGIILGKLGKQGTWDLTYRYEYLEANAWYDQIADDDNVAYYSAAPGGGGQAGYLGGTNVKGHFIKFNYSITDALTFSATCYLNDLINQTVNGTALSNGKDLHFMADLMWKF
jgi:hypothetical protein